MMVPRKQGLIVNISSYGGQTYLFNVAYGIGKAALDRMSVDCGIELKKNNVACLSLMLGAVRTELTSKYIVGSENVKLKGDPNSKQQISVKQVFEEGETVEFGGKLIVKMATDPDIMKYTAKIVIASDYGLKHGIKDIDGRVIPSHRSFKNVAPFMLPKSLMFVTKLVPESVRVPQFLIDVANSKIAR
jgi:dehydrogenase/reductase SDR family protein 1